MPHQTKKPLRPLAITQHDLGHVNVVAVVFHPTVALDELPEELVGVHRRPQAAKAKAGDQADGVARSGRGGRDSGRDHRGENPAKTRN